jgi:molybdate transport system substrate-binding protein
MKHRFNLAAFMPFVLAAFAQDARADQIVVYSSIAARGALELIAPEFERSSGHVVKLKFGTSGDLKSEIEKGAACDAVLLTTAVVDDLIRQNHLAPASRTVVFTSGVGVGVRKGAATPSVATADDLKAVLLKAKSVVMTAQGATGPIMTGVFEKLGIAAAMTPKIVRVSDMTAPEAVAAGKAELVLAQVSEILDVPGSQLLGPLPGNLQSMTPFAIAAAPGASVRPPVQAFIAALAAPPARAHMRALGLQPQ